MIQRLHSPRVLGLFVGVGFWLFLGSGSASTYTWSYRKSMGGISADPPTNAVIYIEYEVGIGQSDWPEGTTPFRPSTYSTSFVLGGRSTNAQMLATPDYKFLALLPPGAEITAAPADGAVWTASLTGLAFYSNVDYRQPVPPPSKPPTISDTLLDEGGPWLDNTNAVAAARFLGGDGWHYGWIGFGWREFNAPVYQPVIINSSFNSNPDSPVWAGEGVFPSLQAEYSGGLLTLSWTSHDAGYILESATSFPNGAWEPIGGTTNTNAKYQISLPATDFRRFFRLRK